MPQFEHQPRHSAKWDRIRFALGMGQMAAAVVAAVLLIDLGVRPISLVAVMATCMLSAISVLLFGRPRGRA